MNPYAAPYQLNDKPAYPLTGAANYQIMAVKEARERRLAFLKKRERNGMIKARVAGSTQTGKEMPLANASAPNIRITNTRTGQRLGYFDGVFVREIPESDLISLNIS